MGLLARSNEHECAQPDILRSRDPIIRLNDLWRCDSCGKLWQATGSGTLSGQAVFYWKRASWLTRWLHRKQV